MPPPPATAVPLPAALASLPPPLGPPDAGAGCPQLPGPAPAACRGRRRVQAPPGLPNHARPAGWVAGLGWTRERGSADVGRSHWPLLWQTGSRPETGKRGGGGEGLGHDTLEVGTSCCCPQLLTMRRLMCAWHARMLTLRVIAVPCLAAHRWWSCPRGANAHPVPRLRGPHGTSGAPPCWFASLHTAAVRRHHLSMQTPYHAVPPPHAHSCTCFGPPWTDCTYYYCPPRHAVHPDSAQFAPQLGCRRHMPTTCPCCALGRFPILNMILILCVCNTCMCACVRAEPERRGGAARGCGAGGPQGAQRRAAL